MYFASQVDNSLVFWHLLKAYMYVDDAAMMQCNGKLHIMPLCSLLSLKMSLNRQQPTTNHSKLCANNATRIYIWKKILYCCSVAFWWYRAMSAMHEELAVVHPLILRFCNLCNKQTQIIWICHQWNNCHLSVLFYSHHNADDKYSRECTFHTRTSHTHPPPPRRN